ncbi:MAG: hypothetical protein M1815_003792 [Lichina confinis]|nr:MAG: hypothetical protein M1815_003792 [Lichina confinis]
MPAPGAGTMGPPSRPAEKATDTAELTDVVAQSGINIKDEESYLTAYFSKDRTAAASAQSQAVLGSPVVPGASALSAANPYHNPAHYTLGQQGTTLGGGSFIQPPIQQTTTEQFIQEQLSAGLRRQDEAKSHHLNNPFLQGASLKLRSVNRSFEKGVYLPPDGLSDVQGTHPRTPAPTATTKHVAGPGGMSAAAVTSSVIPKDSRTAEILTLLSLAAEARMRGLVESAAALAKGRRAGSQGVVPADWADLAVSNGIEPAAPVDTCARKLESRHGTDAVNASVGKGQKRSYSAANGPEPVSSDAPSPPTPVGFPNELAKRMRDMCAKQRSLEEARLAKRAKRSNGAAAAADSSKPGSAGPGTPKAGPATGLLGERAPEAPAKKLSKKEQAKLQNSRYDEAHQHRSANNTARLMMGSGGRFGKKYSWMTAATDTPSRNTPTGAHAGGGAGPTADAAAGTGLGRGGLPAVSGRRLGEWREDRDRAAGIDVRDWLRVLESDTKDKTSIARAAAALR